MPELPEVETVARQLDPLIRGRRVVSVRITDRRLREPGLSAITTNRLKDYLVDSVFRSGKQVVIELSRDASARGKAWLVIHLRMTGRLIYLPQLSNPAGLKPRAVLEFDSGGLVFSDTRRFGTMRLYWSKDEFLPPGIDPLTTRFSKAWLLRQLAGSNQEIKAWLLRQDRITGIGNIYACEALFASGIDPTRSAGSLTPEECGSLYRAIRRILRSAIRHCGTTFSDFQDTSGSTGGYQKYLKVYGRAGQPCKTCGSALDRIVQQQRSTFYCPVCQI